MIADDARRGEAFPDARFDAKVSSLSAIRLPNDVSRGNALPLSPRGAASDSLGAIVGNYKSVTARRINTIRKTPGAPVWQHNYYEHSIRDENELNRMREYIINNPANWDMDEETPRNTR